MIKKCHKCKKIMKQITRGFNSHFECVCGEQTTSFHVLSTSSKNTIPIIKAGRKTGRSMLV